MKWMEEIEMRSYTKPRIFALVLIICTLLPCVAFSSTVSATEALGLKDDTMYYIMNFYTGRLMGLQSNSDANGTNVSTKARAISSLSQWKMDYLQSEGQYQLISANSATAKVLRAASGNLDIYTDSNASTQKFTITRIETGTYQGLYTIKYGSQYVAENSSTNNVYLTSSFGNTAAWSFMAVEKGYADMFSFNYFYTDDHGDRIQFDTTWTNAQSFIDVLNNDGYNAYSNVNSNAKYAFNCLQEDEMFVYHGHGLPGGIIFSRDNDVATGAIVSYEMVTNYSKKYLIGSLSTNSLASLRCVLYIGCSTGVDFVSGSQTSNLVRKTYDKGAHFVLGTTEKIYTTTGNKWLDPFLKAVNGGSNISNACATANAALEWNKVPDGKGGEKSVYGLPSYFVGDSMQFLNIS